MLTTDNISTYVDFIIWVHRNGLTNLPPLPAGVTMVGLDIRIQYGTFSKLHGSIQIARGQFAVTQITEGIGNFQPIRTYNHSGDNTTRQKYYDALACENLNTSQEKLSALIILTSECCRSQMVLSAIQALIKSAVNFSDDVWIGLNFAFTNYKKTCTYLGYEIEAGGKPWTSLRADDYIRYINSDKFTGDKDIAKKIEAVKAYIIANQ